MKLISAFAKSLNWRERPAPNKFVERVHEMVHDVMKWENDAKEHAIMWSMHFLEMGTDRATRHLQLQEQQAIDSLSRDYYFRVVYLPTKTILKELRFTHDPLTYIKTGKYKIKMEVTI